jgi:hypothetical protein
MRGHSDDVEESVYNLIPTPRAVELKAPMHRSKVGCDAPRWWSCCTGRRRFKHAGHPTGLSSTAYSQPRAASRVQPAACSLQPVPSDRQLYLELTSAPQPLQHPGRVAPKVQRAAATMGRPNGSSAESPLTFTRKHSKEPVLPDRECPWAPLPSVWPAAGRPARQLCGCQVCAQYPLQSRLEAGRHELYPGHQPDRLC